MVIELENGDREQITLTETANSSGECIGYINTIGVPPAVVQGDCRLSVNPGAPLSLRVADRASASLLAIATISFLVDPFGIVFDSGDGAPVPGSRVTIIDTATGQPARVFGDDGVSAYPSSVITGQSVTDSGGTVYNFPPGDYRFPFVAPGTYRLVVQPPAPFTAPSAASPGDLAGSAAPTTACLRHQPRVMAILYPEQPRPVRVDILWTNQVALIVRKTTSTQVAVRAMSCNIGSKSPIATRGAPRAR